MAKHRRRHYKGLSSVRFGAFSLPDTVNTKGLAMGLGVGLAGALGLRYLWNTTSFLASYKADATKAGATGIWPAVNKNLPAVGATLAAVAAYFLAKKKSPALAASLALGAGAFAVTQGAFGVAQTLSPSFQGLQTVALGGGRYGAMLAPDNTRLAAYFAPSAPSRLPGVNVPARMGAMMVAQQNPRMAGLIAQHAALRNRR